MGGYKYDGDYPYLGGCPYSYIHRLRISAILGPPIIHTPLHLIRIIFLNLTFGMWSISNEKGWHINHTVKSLNCQASQDTLEVMFVTPWAFLLCWALQRCLQMNKRWCWAKFWSVKPVESSLLHSCCWSRWIGVHGTQSHHLPASSSPPWLKCISICLIILFPKKKKIFWRISEETFSIGVHGTRSYHLPARFLLLLSILWLECIGICLCVFVYFSKKIRKCLSKFFRIICRSP